LLESAGYTNLLGVDPAPAMIAAARQRFPSISFHEVADPLRVNLVDGSVDAVLLFTVLTCVPTDAGQRAIIQEISRVLRPRGLLYISDLWLQTDARNIERYVRDQPKYGTYGVFDLEEDVTVRHHDPRWLGALTTGYDSLALDAVQVQTMNGHSASGFQWFGLKLG
jgi:SAM-dependent methyltransferase